MFKGLLFLLSLGSASAATIATSVTCDSVTITSDSGGVECHVAPPPGWTDGDPGAAFAEVNASGSTRFAYPGALISVSANDYAAGLNGLAITHTSAHAYLSGLFELTVTGGMGGGSFAPCLWTEHIHAQAEATLVSDSLGDLWGCGGSGPSPWPFTYDVPQVFTLTLSADTGCCDPWGGQAYAELAPFKFWDANGNPLSDVAYSFTEVPEPGNLAAAGALLLAVAKFWRRWRR